MFGHLPYFVNSFIGPGWTCVGDAGGFLDPFYSPGLDQMAFSVYSRVGLIQKALSGTPADEMAKEYELHNKRYARYFTYFYEAIFRDKYYVMGDYDTMTIAFLMDTALYYLAAIIPTYRWSSERLGIPPYYQDGSEIAFYPMRFYNRRLVAIAKRKKALGIYGNHNAGRRPGFVGFSVRSAAGSCSGTASCAGRRPSSRTPCPTWSNRRRSADRSRTFRRTRKAVPRPCAQTAQSGSRGRHVEP